MVENFSWGVSHYGTPLPIVDNFFRSRAEGEALFCGKDVAESLGYKLPHKAVLAMLPKEFTREQVRELRMAQGLKPNPPSCCASG